MERNGRKPLGTKHVQGLEGSEQAKLRLEVILKTLSGEITIPQACTRLGIREARFHELRRDWLQAALEQLEPRPAGRPPRERPKSSREEDLAVDNQRLREELQLAHAKQEVAGILSAAGSASTVKKMRAQRGPELRRAQRYRPR